MTLNQEMNEHMRVAMSHVTVRRKIENQELDVQII